MHAVVSELRAQIAGSRLSPIPQGNEEPHSSSDGEKAPGLLSCSPAEGLIGPSKAAPDEEAQHCSEPEAPSTPRKGERLPAISAAHPYRSQQLCQGGRRGGGHPGLSRPRRCDLSGQWVRVVAAAAIVMIITAASMYSASAPPMTSASLMAKHSGRSLTYLHQLPDLKPHAVLFMQHRSTCMAREWIPTLADLLISSRF